MDPPDLPRHLADALRSADWWEKTTTVVAERLDADHPWTTEHGGAMNAAAGDWLIRDGDREWTVAADVFTMTYERTDDGTYRKTTPVRAVQVSERTDVPTLEGTAPAQPGDWLVQNPEGEVYPVPRAKFEATYAPAEPPSAS